MTGTRRHHHNVDTLQKCLPPATRTKLDGNTVHGVGHLPDCRCMKNERAGGETPFDDRLHLRRDAKAVYIPIGPQQADDAAALDDGQRAPDITTLAANTVENRVPANSRGLGLGKSVPDSPQQGPRRAGRRIGKFAVRLRSGKIVAPRAQATARDGGDPAAMSTGIERCDDIRSG